VSHLLKISTLTFIGAIGLGGVAQGADLYTPSPSPGPIYSSAPAYNWTGFYAGINGGYGWGNSSSDTPFDVGDMDGWFAGGQLGYNFQFANNVVVGLEGDLQWSDMSGSTAGPIVGSTITQDLNWFGTVRGRIGYAFGAWLPYVTGGFAYGEGDRTTTLGGGLSESKMHIGYTLGAGVEVGITPNWTGKLEYQYLDFGSETYSSIPGTPSVDMDAHTVRVGLNYKF
jgi:outer membrane immunogenic protein